MCGTTRRGKEKEGYEVGRAKVAALMHTREYHNRKQKGRRGRDSEVGRWGRGKSILSLSNEVKVKTMEVNARESSGTLRVSVSGAEGKEVMDGLRYGAYFGGLEVVYVMLRPSCH